MLPVAVGSYCRIGECLLVVVDVQNYAYFLYNYIELLNQLFSININIPLYVQSKKLSIQT
jgi:hypothetical protein